MSASASADPTHRSDRITYGVHHSPEEFVVEALKVGHPTRLHSMFPDETHEVVENFFRLDCRSIARDRTEEIKRWLHMSADLKDSEEKLKGSMSEQKCEILSNEGFFVKKQPL